MLQIVSAITDLGHIKGLSGAHFFSCDDNKEYIVKFVDGTKTAVNEIVGGSLALKIGLPTPNLALVNVNQDIIKFSSDLSQRNIREGVHIGFSRLPTNTEDFHLLNNQSFVTKTLENEQDLYGVICFDNWVLNVDRNNVGNNMIEALAHNKIRYYMVDFGHCFTGNGWDEGIENSKDNLQLTDLLQFFYQYIKDFGKFEIWFSTIKMKDGRKKFSTIKMKDGRKKLKN